MINVRSHSFIWRILSLATAFTLAACGESGGLSGLVQTGQIVGGGTKEIAGVQPVGGILPNSSLLNPGAAGQPDLVYRSSTANFASYNKVLLDPVEIWTAQGSQLNTVPAAQRQAAANTFYSDLYKALIKRSPMVTSPLPRTMHIRVALVDATLPNATENTIATYTPYVSTAYDLASLAFNNGVGYFAGAATAEGYATDATTGNLLWKAVDKTRRHHGDGRENTLNNWNDVDHAFQAWSEQLALRMQQLGTCQR
jgi:hypothetical protein